MNGSYEYTPAETVEETESAFKNFETVFAWLCILFGYLFCRAFPASASPIGFVLVSLIVFAATAVILKLKGARFGLLTIPVLVSVLAANVGILLTGEKTLIALAFIWTCAAYNYFVYVSMGNELEKGFSDLVLMDFLRAVIILPFSSLIQLFKAAFSGKRNGKTVLSVLLGVALTIIPTALVASNLSYDKSFTEIMRNLFDFDFGEVLSHIGSLLLGVAVAMYVFGLYYASTRKVCENAITKDGCRKASEKIRIAPVITVLVAVLPLLALYGIFFFSQWENYVSAFSKTLPSGFSYAEYAREGFFELCSVSAINLGVLALIALFMKRENKIENVVLKVISVVFSLCTLVLIATALSKMFLYIEKYGMTPKRIGTTWFMFTLAVVFVLIIIKQFAKNIKLVCASVLVFLLMFSVFCLFGYDKFIADYNVDKYISGDLDTVDVRSLIDLGDPAVPALFRLAEYYDGQNGTDIKESVLSPADEIILASSEPYKLIVRNFKAKRYTYGDVSFFDRNVPYYLARSEFSSRSLLAEEK